jgi:hypothetical protein
MLDRTKEYIFTGVMGPGAGHWGKGATPAEAKQNARDAGWYPIPGCGWQSVEVLKAANARVLESNGAIVFDYVAGYTIRECEPKLLRFNPGGPNGKTRKGTKADVDSGFKAPASRIRRMLGNTEAGLDRVLTDADINGDEDANTMADSSTNKPYKRMLKLERALAKRVGGTRRRS